MPTYKTTTLEHVGFVDPADRKAKKLLLNKVPLVIDDWSLAFRLGFTGKVLWYAITLRETLYQVFKIRKASGGFRTIHNPRKLMRIIAKQLRFRILIPLIKGLGEHVAAYRLGRGIKKTAEMHLSSCATCAPHDGVHTCKQDVVLEGTGYKFDFTNRDSCMACQRPTKHACTRRGVKIHLDLTDFFGSTRRAWIRNYFHQVVGYNHYVSGLLAHLMTVRLQKTTYSKGSPKGTYQWHGVPQGAPFSGDITNLIADWRLDGPVMQLLKPLGWTYTRYADDLYLSHPENLSREVVNDTLKKVDKLIVESGYRMNRKKLEVLRAGRRQAILGIVINQKIGMPNDTYRRMRSLVHRCYHKGFESQLKFAKKQHVDEFHAWLGGKLTYYATIDAHKAEKLRLVYDLAKDRWNGEKFSIKAAV